jgi:hypothetical protein
MATPADVPGSRLLPSYRAGHTIKRLPSRALGDGEVCGRSRGAACCQPIELPRDKAAPLQGAGRWRHLRTFPGAACCQPIELPRDKAAPLQGAGHSETCRRSREPLAASL